MRTGTVLKQVIRAQAENRFVTIGLRRGGMYCGMVTDVWAHGDAIEITWFGGVSVLIASKEVVTISMRPPPR